MMRRLTVSLLAMALSIVSASAQAYKSFMQVKMEADASMINCMIQDSNGLIWLGTNRGLFCYDGYTVYAHNRSGQHIYCGLEIGGRLYLGGDDGLLIYDYHSNGYNKPPIKFPTDIRTMARDGDNLWIGSFGGLYLYNIRRNTIQRFDTRHDHGLPNNTIYAIVKSRDSRIYIGTYDGLCYYDHRSRRFHKIYIEGSKHKSNVFVNTLLEDRARHCLWIGTEGNLYKYSGSTSKVERIKGFGDNSVKALETDGQHQLLIGTDNGMYVCDGSNVTRHIRHDSRNASSLTNDIVWNIFRDRDGNIWMGTDDGLSMAPSKQDATFVPISQITGQGDGNHFYAIYRDKRGTLWLGGSNGLISSDISLARPQTCKWYRMDNAAAPLAHNRIRQIYEDRDGDLWICTDGGLHRYENGQWHRYNLEDKSRTLNANWAYNIYEDGRGRLWVATCLGGILVVDKKKLVGSGDYCIADYSFNTHNGLGGMFINQIVPDARGNMDVLLYNSRIAIQRIDMKTMRVSNIGYRGDYPTFLMRDSHGKLWLGGKGVLYMAEVDGEIWQATNNGVWMFNKEQHKFVRIGNTSKTFSSIYYDKKSGKVYLGSVDGLVCTLPSEFKREPQRHPLQLMAVYANNQPSFGTRLQFGADQNHLAFEFSDLPYGQSDKNLFVYMLKGVDKTWNTLPPNTNRITFDNLPYGKYSLLISRVDANGNTSRPLTVNFRISPPWYLSWWAEVIYALLAIWLVLWAVNFYRIRNRLHQEHMEKERIMQQSRQKMDFFTNISHDFKTPLSMIIAPLSRLLLSVKDKDAYPQIELAQRNAMKLNAMIHQLIDFDRIDNNVNSTLIIGCIDIVELCKKVFATFQESIFAEKHIQATFSCDTETSYQNLDMLKIESAVTNVVSNAAKYTPEGGNVTMTVCISDDISIEVADSGIGIPEKDLPYVSQRFFQSSSTKNKKEGTGIGLYMAKAYIELHGGTFKIASAEGQGTTVTITLPCNAADNAAEAQATETTTDGTTQLPTVVLVDDKKEVTDFMTDILKSHFNCVSAGNGRQGLDLCTELKPDLVITDMMMPVMDGMEMCRQLRKSIPTSTTPIIMLTAKDDKDTELESINQSIDIFISKPFDANILLSRSLQLVGKKNKEEKKERLENITAPKKIEAESDDEKFLLQVTQLIEDHADDFEFNVNSLCELLGMGNKLIYRKTKQLTGQTPVEYIKNIRMKKAAMLLEQHKFTVSEVMYMVGYSSSSYFSKCFSAAFGMSPKEYSER